MEVMPSGTMEANRRVKVSVRAAGKVLEQNDKQTGD